MSTRKLSDRVIVESYLDEQIRESIADAIVAVSRRLRYLSAHAVGRDIPEPEHDLYVRCKGLCDRLIDEDLVALIYDMLSESLGSFAEKDRDAIKDRVAWHVNDILS